MKKFIAFLLVLLILSAAFSGCSQYVSKYRAVGFVHSNDSDSAFMNFYTFEGRMVFKLKCRDGSAEEIRYTAKLETGSADVYADFGGEKTKLCTVLPGDETASSFRPPQQGTGYIIVETAEKCQNGDFHFNVVPSDAEEEALNTGAEVDGGSLAYIAKVAYANAFGDTRILSEALNADSMHISSVQHLPVYRFETVSELQDFRTTFADTLTFDRGYDEIPSFDSYAAEYGDAFFKNHALILCYVQAASGSYRYGIADVSVNGDTLCLYVKQLNHPQVMTADMAGWFVMAEVRKEDVENCKRFDAQMANANIPDGITADYDGDAVTTLQYGDAEPEYAVASFSNLTGARGKHTALSQEDNAAVAQLIDRQEFGDPYDNLNDVILTDVRNEDNVYYDSDAGILTRGDSAVKLSDADKDALNQILSRYVTLGIE